MAAQAECDKCDVRAEPISDSFSDGQAETYL